MNELKLKVDDQIKSNLLFFVRNFVNKTSKKKRKIYSKAHQGYQYFKIVNICLKISRGTIVFYE